MFQHRPSPFGQSQTAVLRLHQQHACRDELTVDADPTISFFPVADTVGGHLIVPVAEDPRVARADMATMQTCAWCKHTVMSAISLQPPPLGSHAVSMVRALRASTRSTRLIARDTSFWSKAWSCASTAAPMISADRGAFDSAYLSPTSRPPSRPPSAPTSRPPSRQPSRGQPPPGTLTQLFPPPPSSSGSSMPPRGDGNMQPNYYSPAAGGGRPLTSNSNQHRLVQ